MAHTRFESGELVMEPMSRRRSRSLSSPQEPFARPRTRQERRRRDQIDRGHHTAEENPQQLAALVAVLARSSSG
jgi:hypothetical protein